MGADTTKKAIAPPLIIPGIPLNEVVITGVRALANTANQGARYLLSGASAGAGGVGTFLAAFFLPSNYHQKTQYADYGLPTAQYTINTTVITGSYTITTNSGKNIMAKVVGKELNNRQKGLQ